MNIKTPEIPAIIGTVEDNSPAFLAGLEVGDQVILINNLKVKNWEIFTNILRKNPNNILQLKVLRDNSYLDITLVPTVKTINNKDYGYAGI